MENEVVTTIYVKMKRLFFLMWMTSALIQANAQGYVFLNEVEENTPLLNHLDASVTFGTTGIGVDLASPVTNWTQIRVGYSFMPRFHYPMTFEVQVGDTKESKYDTDGNRIETKFDKMAALLEDMTGYKAEDQVDMIGRPTYHNLKFMVDVFPFKYDKRWHVTAGFFWGPSKIANAYNVTEAMPSLLAVGMYNQLYEKTMISYESVQKARNGEIPYYEIIPIISVGSYEINSPTEIEALYKKLHANGRMGIHLGDFINEEGNKVPYLMEPGSDGMVKAEVRVNSFKPYLGFGYGGRLIKDDDRFHIAVDLGAMFWGGTPNIVTHDGTNLAKDVTNVGGKVGDYTKLIKTFKVFPVLDVRLVYSIF